MPRITARILQGRKGPKRDVVCLNAAPALVAGRKAKTLQEGFRLAGQVIDSGAAAEKLARLVAYHKTRRLTHDPVEDSRTQEGRTTPQAEPWLSVRP